MCTTEEIQFQLNFQTIDEIECIYEALPSTTKIPPTSISESDKIVNNNYYLSSKMASPNFLSYWTLNDYVTMVMFRKFPTTLYRLNSYLS